MSQPPALYSALVSAGASAEKAQAAVEEAFSYRSLRVVRKQVRVVLWMTGVLLALVVIAFGLLLELLRRL
jgi:hypothetical protein